MPGWEGGWGGGWEGGWEDGCKGGWEGGWGATRELFFPSLSSDFSVKNNYKTKKNTFDEKS